MSSIDNDEADYRYAQYQDFQMQNDELGVHEEEQQDE